MMGYGGVQPQNAVNPAQPLNQAQPQQAMPPQQGYPQTQQSAQVQQAYPQTQQGYPQTQQSAQVQQAYTKPAYPASGIASAIGAPLPPNMFASPLPPPPNMVASPLPPPPSGAQTTYQNVLMSPKFQGLPPEDQQRVLSSIQIYAQQPMQMQQPSPLTLPPPPPPSLDAVRSDAQTSYQKMLMDPNFQGLPPEEQQKFQSSYQQYMQNLPSAYAQNQQQYAQMMAQQPMQMQQPSTSNPSDMAALRRAHLDNARRQQVGIAGLGMDPDRMRRLASIASLAGGVRR